MTTDLVGRDEEVALVTGRLASGGSVVLAGAAGVGKTRLAREVLDRVEADGRTVRRAFATRAAARTPLGPLALVLPAGVSGGDRRHLARRAADALGGCVLFVDDAHLLDDLSVDVVRRVDGPVLLTVRTGETVPDGLGSLERVEVQALSQADVELMVERTLGGPVAGPAAAAVYGASRGNPLYARELVAEARRRAILRDDGGVWRLSGRLAAPAHLAELVAGNVAALDEAARTALQTLAVAGEVARASLETICGSDAVTALSHNGMIELSADGNRTVVRPAHPLFGEVVRDAISPLAVAERQRALAAEILRHGHRRDGDALRAAEWLLDADGTAPADLLMLAVRDAVRRFDLDAQIRLSRAAIAAGAGDEASLTLAEAFRDAHRASEAEELLSSIRIDELRDTDEGFLRIRYAYTRAYNLALNLDRMDDARRILSDAQHLVGADLLPARATLELIAGRLRAAEALVRGFDGPPRITLLTVHPLASAVALSGRCAEALDILEAAGSHPYLDRFHSPTRIFALTALGRFADAEAAAEDGYRRSIDAWGTGSEAEHALHLGRIALARGHVRTAAGWFREATAVLRAIGDVPDLRASLGGLAAALAMAGDASGAREAVAELDATGGTTPFGAPELVTLGPAWTLAAHGRLADARREIERAIPRARDDGQAVHEAVLLHHLHRLGGAPDLERGMELARIVGGDLVGAWNAPLDARAQLQAAERLSSIGADIDAAETALRASRLARAGGLRGIAEEASRLASEAIARCEGAQTPALAVERTRLTPREREIAAMAASGLSSARIAEQLALSVRTVENHLQHAFEKLGVRGRGDLAGALDPAGIAGALDPAGIDPPPQNPSR